MIKEGALQEAEEVIEEEDVPDPDAFEVSIVDDTPEEDRGRVKQADDDVEDADDDDEEVDETQFSKRIQKGLISFAMITMKRDEKKSVFKEKIQRQ